MATPYSVPIEAFFRRIEADRGFFNYFNLSDQQAMALAIDRAAQYMRESCARIMFECPDGANFTDYDDVLQVLAEDLNPREVHLLSSLMYEMYLDRDIAKLRCMTVNFTPSDLRVFDPSNARSTFMEMYNAVVAKNAELLDWYRNTDRGSGALIGINFSEFDDEG